MQLVDQHTKKIMEECKLRALDAGLKFDKESLEYMVTNMDMLELSPKNMIPTLYDYWLQDIQILRGIGEYEVYPNNPYETVINTRPAISFYNDNNPDWLNVMIFYHVLAHIDFFQNNKYFQNTWEYDFKEKALTEKRIIAKLRSEKGHIVDYLIEFTKSMDNLIGYYDLLNEEEVYEGYTLQPKIDFYFNFFIPRILNESTKLLLEEIERYNAMDKIIDKDKIYIRSIIEKYPEFVAKYEDHKKKKPTKQQDIIEFILSESKFLNSNENSWMKTVVEIVRDTSLYFAPMMRTKIMNEGWASYWHEKLFMMDDRIKGNEVSFARINAKVTSLSKVGLNPYAIGWRLFMFVEESANKGRYTYDYNKLSDIDKRKKYNQELSIGEETIFDLRTNYCDQIFLSKFVNQDFVDKHNLMVVGQRFNEKKNVIEYYVKSKKAKDYKEMIMQSLFHPPHIEFQVDRNDALYISHKFEGKELYRDYISNTLIGIEYLWGNSVKLETTEIDWEKKKNDEKYGKYKNIQEYSKPVLYSTKDKVVKKEQLKVAS